MGIKVYKREALESWIKKEFISFLFLLINFVVWQFIHMYNIFWLLLSPHLISFPPVSITPPPYQSLSQVCDLILFCDPFTFRQNLRYWHELWNNKIIFHFNNVHCWYYIANNILYSVIPHSLTNWTAQLLKDQFLEVCFCIWDCLTGVRIIYVHTVCEQPPHIHCIHTHTYTWSLHLQTCKHIDKWMHFKKGNLSLNLRVGHLFWIECLHYER